MYVCMYRIIRDILIVCNFLVGEGGGRIVVYCKCLWGLWGKGLTLHVHFHTEVILGTLFFVVSGMCLDGVDEFSVYH